MVSYIYLRQFLCPPVNIGVDTNTVNDDAIVYKSFCCAQTALKKIVSGLLIARLLSLPLFLIDGSGDCDPNEFQKVVSGIEIQRYEPIVLVFPDINLWHDLVISWCR